MTKYGRWVQKYYENGWILGTEETGQGQKDKQQYEIGEIGPVILEV